MSGADLADIRDEDLSPPRYLQELEGHVSPAREAAGMNNVAQVCRRLRRTGLGKGQTPLLDQRGMPQTESGQDLWSVGGPLNHDILGLSSLMNSGGPFASLR